MLESDPAEVEAADEEPPLALDVELVDTTGIAAVYMLGVIKDGNENEGSIMLELKVGFAEIE